MTREEIFEYVKQEYGTLPEYLWESSPEHAVLRHSGNSKWYAIIMRVNEQNLGLQGSKDIDVINVKCDPITVGALRLQDGFLPAYHMNKDKWISVILDSIVPKEMIFDLIDSSYNAVAPKRKHKSPVI